MNVLTHVLMELLKMKVFAHVIGKIFFWLKFFKHVKLWILNAKPVQVRSHVQVVLGQSMRWEQVVWKVAQKIISQSLEFVFVR